MAFTNAKIEPAASEHVLDSFLGFVRACGVDPGPASWNIVVPENARQYADRVVPDTRPSLVISPCSSHAARNWPADRYAAVADHAARVHGMRVILAGGRSAQERLMGADIVAHATAPLVDQIGRDTLPELLGLLAKNHGAGDAGFRPRAYGHHGRHPRHRPCTRRPAPRAPALNYSRQWCVDKYDEASRLIFHKPAAAIPWTEKIERAGVMDLISVQDVTGKLDALMAQAKIR